MISTPPGGVAVEDGVARCWWCSGDPLYQRYHDGEWGRPVSDDVRIFEKLCLEGFMSGLSWLTILRKRENFRAAFKGFDPEAVARYDSRSVERLLQDAGIVRHRGKVEATINNARRYLELVDAVGSLAAHVWSYEPPRRASPPTWAELVQNTTCHEAVALSKDLKKRGWRFVGPTTVYSMMEAAGLVNDHVAGCDIADEVERARAAFDIPTVLC